MIDGTMTREQSDAVYDILVADCGAIDDSGGGWRSAFATAQAQGCPEFRFSGVFGFGGKFWIGDFAVNYYREDMTPKLDRICDAVNAKLAALRQSWVSAQ